MEKQRLKNPVMVMMRRKVNTPNSGMSLASPLNLALLRMQLTGTDWQNFSDLRGIYFVFMYTHSSFPAALSLNAIVFFLGIWGTYLVFELSYSTKSDGKLTSLDQYISRMKSGQKDIFYITGSSKEQLEKSPFLERLKKKNYEVQLIVKRFGL
jgi:hypothetical protein